MLEKFFRERLVVQMNASTHTICSYRDTFRMILLFFQSQLDIGVDKLTMQDFNADNILDFLNYCENDRHNCINTRNQRLSSIKSFMKYATFLDPTLFLQNERILMIPNKKHEQRVLGYLTKDEVETILESVNRNTYDGRRYYSVLLFLYNTGARVSEAVNLTVADVKIAKGASQVLINGKGSKQRITPIWDETAQVLLDLISEQGDSFNPTAFVFKNHIGNAITRNGIRYIVDATVQNATKKCPSLSSKNITPHIFRHTTAMHLLQSGVDINSIRLWLGHVKLDTTNRYIESDIEMKRQSLLKGGIIIPSQSQYQKPSEEILHFLDTLGE